MAFHIHHHILLLLITTLSTRATAEKPGVLTPDLIGTICPKALNATLCFKHLKFLIGMSIEKADVELILDVQVAGGLAIYKFTLTSDVKDPVLQKRYISCLTNYNNAALIDLVKAQHILSSKTGYKNLPSKISAAIKESETCDKAFDQPPSMNPSIKEITKNFQDLSSIALLVANIIAS